MGNPEKRLIVRNIPPAANSRISPQHLMFLPRTHRAVGFASQCIRSKNITCGQSITDNEFPGKCGALSKRVNVFKYPPTAQVLTAVRAGEGTSDKNKMCHDPLGIQGMQAHCSYYDRLCAPGVTYFLSQVSFPSIPSAYFWVNHPTGSHYRPPESKFNISLRRIELES